ncbi:MAG: gamma-glutamyl-gamma-aminobutyrate hydrolase family protein, partial [Clostridia bacterium]|nr:gamma-glutamyl-gamma-aminobutyrate hydrolase family protein [Clostridia bacterium]
MPTIIGLTPSVDHQSERLQLNLDYMDAVLRVGAIPVILPLSADEAVLSAALQVVDGVVFTGGADLSPALYQEEVLPCCGETSPLRDQAEPFLMRTCIKSGIPFLAICRGFEVMNVALGGSLYQDIAEQMSQTLRHPQYQKPAEKVHIVQVDQASALYRLTGMSELGVNSRHHQGIKRLGAGLSVSAVAPDGLVEGIELPEHPFAIGIQWHPETLSYTSP